MLFLRAFFAVYLPRLTKIKIAYITETEPSDKHAWSGTVHYVYKALIEEGYEVIGLGPARPFFLRYFLAGINKISLAIFKKRFDYRHSKIYSRAFGRLFSTKLKSINYDCVVLCGSTECGAYLKTDKPKYYILDRTIKGAINYHTILSGLWDFSKRQSIYTDKKAMVEASKLLFSSSWASKHAEINYGISPHKFEVLPFGANLDSVPIANDIPKRDIRTQQRLLLIGTYWKNKGADIAFNALLILLGKNYNASLTVVGCEPPEHTKHPRLHIISFVDKNSAAGLVQLKDLFLSHDFFILPTRFDCTPIVFCEASAFGLPILTADTGGVAGHIREGENGFLIPFEDQGEAYAQQIISLVEDHKHYEQLCVSSRKCYEEELNWKHWASEFKKRIGL